MPTYEYQCDKCRRVFEVKQRISAPALTTCDACGGEVRRLLSAAPFILKGEGWYVTDYPSEARKKARESEKSAPKSAPAGEGKTDNQKADNGKKDAKPSTTGAAASGAPASTPSASSSSSSD